MANFLWVLIADSVVYCAGRGSKIGLNLQLTPADNSPLPSMIMRLSTLLALPAMTVLAAVPTSNILVQILPNSLLPDPDLLGPSTSATIQRYGVTHRQPLTRQNSFDFAQVDVGSYLLTVHCRDFSFAPLRIDVTPLPASETTAPSEADSANAGEHARIDAWQTFWGHEWSNKGEHRGGGNDGLVIGVTADRRKDFLTERGGFSPLQFFKSPMILMAVFTLAMTFGFPYLMNNMDEETRAEFEDLQQNSAIGKASNPASNLQNFDFAAWMTGQGKESQKAPETRRKG